MMDANSLDAVTSNSASTSQKEENFESLIADSKAIISSLNKPDITLKDSVELYKKGVEKLQKAQKLLEDAKIQYGALKNPNI